MLTRRSAVVDFSLPNAAGHVVANSKARIVFAMSVELPLRSSSVDAKSLESLKSVDSRVRVGERR